MKQTRHHSAKDRNSERPHHFAAGTGAPHYRQQARKDRSYCHHFWPKPEQGTFHYGIKQRLLVEFAEFFLLSGDSLFEIDDHYDRGLHRGAEQRDESDPDGHREVVAE